MKLEGAGLTLRKRGLVKNVSAPGTQSRQCSLSEIQIQG